MGRRRFAGRPDEDSAEDVGKNRRMPSGRSEGLMDLPYDLGVLMGWDVMLSYT